MKQNTLRYQPVQNSDGTVSIHESIIDSDGKITSISYLPVKLESSSIGELQNIIRQVYRHIPIAKPITEDELYNLLYGEELATNNVIDLCDYFKGKRE